MTLNLDRMAQGVLVVRVQKGPERSLLQSPKRPMNRRWRRVYLLRRLN